MKIRSLLLIFLLLGIAQTNLAQDAIANQILARVNLARTEAGIAPLAMNPQLIQAAQRHSTDMATQGSLTHVGSDGTQFWERIQATGYSLTTAGENVLYRGDTDGNGAFQQWFDSPPHRENMLNSQFLEIGLAYSRSASGTYYYTMVLASRANITPLPIPPTVTLLPTNTAIPTATPTLVPPSLTPAPTDPLIATLLAPLPTNTSPATQAAFVPMIVTNTPFPTLTPYVAPDIRLIFDETSFSLINVAGRPLNLANVVFESSSGSLAVQRWDTEFLSQSLTGFTDGDCLQVWGLATEQVPKPAACDVRHSWIVVNNAGQFWRNTDVFTVRNGTNRVGLCETRLGVCEVNLSRTVEAPLLNPVFATPAATDLRLFYTATSFALVNVSGRNLDLDDLIFRSESGVFPVERWNTQFLTQPLYNFSTWDCLQIWGFETQNPLAAPDSCRIRHAWVAVGTDADFWRDTNFFTLERNNIRLATCEVSLGTCEASLSANLGAVESSANTATTTTNQNQSTTSSDMQLIITQTSVTLINMSNRALDVSNLAFESDSGVFVASRWNTPDLSRALTSLPAGDCLQVWLVGAQYEAAPRACRVRHAWVAVASDAQFWLNTNVFRVRRGAEALTTCETRIDTCNFNLP